MMGLSEFSQKMILIHDNFIKFCKIKGLYETFVLWKFGAIQYTIMQYCAVLGLGSVKNWWPYDIDFNMMVSLCKCHGIVIAFCVHSFDIKKLLTVNTH